MNKPGSTGVVLMLSGFLLSIISVLSSSYYVIYGVLLIIVGMIAFVVQVIRK